MKGHSGSLMMLKVLQSWTDLLHRKRRRGSLP